MTKVLFISAAVLLLCGCKHTVQNTLFTSLPSGYTGVDFSNQVTENDSINPIDMEYLYNGGGVATGDFNRDGKPDLFFTGSQVSNRLYLNLGDYKFEDVTNKAGLSSEGRWSNSASVVDINNDGWPDIYICCTNSKDPSRRRNLLYINQGNDKEGVPRFKEMAKEYGLADTSYSVMAAFFDADNDGDLDMFLLTTYPASRNVVYFSGTQTTTPVAYRCKLYQNNWDPKLHHAVFKNISQQAGIIYDGYGLGLSITDVNQDGWKDICITNDFLSNDVLYINNHDGTFTNKESSYFKHSSESAMGNDFADINNDGLPDLVSVDMAAELNYRKKKNGSANNYTFFENMERMGYMLQYPRNMLQINQGKYITENGKESDPVFSETGYLSGIAETDWSWSPLFADFDDDGFKDLMITNGYPKDVTDHDFAVFRHQAYANTPKREILDQIPSIKIPNYSFKNRGDGTFVNSTAGWGLDVPSFSNGAIYVDLNGKGHLDYVVNNINDKVFIYKNNLNEHPSNTANFLNVKFKGGGDNINGLGAVALLKYGGGKKQLYENSPYKGYLSCVQDIAHFGLGAVKIIDTLEVTWPGGKSQTITKIKANQLLVADIKNAVFIHDPATPKTAPVFKEVTKSVNINYVHQEADQIDFNVQKLLPHKLSQYGPALAVADIDGNGTDDIFIGGSTRSPGVFLLQGKNGKFTQRSIKADDRSFDDLSESRGVLFFDAQGLGRQDLYITGGSNENPQLSPHYQDKLYLNDGKGNFKFANGAIPLNYTSKSCVKAADFNKDGSMDLFIGGRLIPGQYPKPASCILLQNNSKNGVCKFTDVTEQIAPCLKNIGMVTDALWTDFDEDGWPDLILVGEYMPVTFIRNDHGHFVNITDKTGLQNEKGCWNSIVSGDFTNSGKLDYVVGNLGGNTFYRATKEHPVRVYGKDFNNDGAYDAIPSLYLKDQDGDYKEFPAFTRDDMIKQMIGFRKKYLSYKDFATATMTDVLNENERKGALVVEANNMQTSIISHLGKYTFKMTSLPLQAQYAPVYGMVAEDFDGDGNLDLALTGNDFGMEPGSGRCDALNGLILKGDGRGHFRPLSLLKSGLFIPGDGKALVKLRSNSSGYLLAASQNQGALKIFELNQVAQLISLKPGDLYALINLKNGQQRKVEFYYGDSFESQSSRFIKADTAVKSIFVFNSSGTERVVYLRGSSK